MAKNNIDIISIKERIRRNPKYVHPCNKDFLDDIKRFGFDSGHDYITWMQQNGILKNPNEIDYGYYNKLVQHRGFKDINDYRRKQYKRNIDHNRNIQKMRLWEKGIYLPMEFNEDCSAYFGVEIGERLFKRFLEENIFEYVNITGYHDKGIDFFCRNPKQEFINKYPQFKLERNKEYKIQLEVRCLRIRKDRDRICWEFTHIDYNKTADYFLLCGWESNKNGYPLHIWLIHRDDIIRGDKFCARNSFSITNKLEYLIEFKRYEINELERLIENLNLEC